MSSVSASPLVDKDPLGINDQPVPRLEAINSAPRRSWRANTLLLGVADLAGGRGGSGVGGMDEVVESTPRFGL